MLGSIDPVIIFQLYKLVPETTPTLSKIPISPGLRRKTTFAIIPIYLSEKITGVFIKDESKNIDIETNTSSLSNGEGAAVDQKALGSIVSVTLQGKRSSVGLTILTALAEQILDKVTSQEYEVTYVHGSITVFGGLIHGISITPIDNEDRVEIKVDIARGRPKTTSVQVAQKPDAVRLGTTGITPPVTAPTAAAPAGASGGQSAISPGVLP